MKTLTILILTAALSGMLGAPASAKGPKHCPPGLAKKSPACVPPGLARKGEGHDTTTRNDNELDRDHDRYETLRTGDVITLDGKEYVVVRTDGGTLIRRGDDLYRLPRPEDGSDYVRVGDVIMKVDRKTKAMIDLIRITDLILS